VYATDLDGDGDTDVLFAYTEDDKLAWYENDGSENFTERVISTAATKGPSSVYATDLDGDGDTDVLFAFHTEDRIAWYENDGSQNFTPHVVSTSGFSLPSVIAADVDGDGDLDVLSASNADRIAWYENRLSASGDLGKEPRDPNILPWNPPIPAPPAPRPTSVLDRTIAKHIDSPADNWSQTETETLTKPIRRIARLSSHSITTAQRDAFFVESDLRMSFAGF
jgi:hypothetical protein